MFLQKVESSKKRGLENRPWHLTKEFEVRCVAEVASVGPCSVLQLEHFTLCTFKFDKTFVLRSIAAMRCDAMRCAAIRRVYSPKIFAGKHNTQLDSTTSKHQCEASNTLWRQSERWKQVSGQSMAGVGWRLEVDEKQVTWPIITVRVARVNRGRSSTDVVDVDRRRREAQNTQASVSLPSWCCVCAAHSNRSFVRYVIRINHKLNWIE